MLILVVISASKCRCSSQALAAPDATPLTGALPIMADNQLKIIPTDLENSLMHRTARTRLGHSVLLLKQKPPIIYFCIQNLFALSAQHLY